jgi:hypothetical protein
MDERIQFTVWVLVVFLFFGIIFAVVASNFAKIEGLWFVFPYVGSIRISTVVTAVACFMLVLFLTRKNGLKSVYYASLAVVFSMGLYELVWWNSAVVLANWEPRNWAFAALLGWVFLGVREVFRTRPPTISIALYGTYVVSMITWIGLGFKFSVFGTSTYAPNWIRIPYSIRQNILQKAEWVVGWIKL